MFSNLYLVYVTSKEDAISSFSCLTTDGTYIFSRMEPDLCN